MDGKRSTSEGFLSQSTVEGKVQPACTRITFYTPELLHKNAGPFFYDFIKLREKEGESLHCSSTRFGMSVQLYIIIMNKMKKIVPLNRIVNTDERCCPGSEFDCPVAGETDKILNKWDNHNTIARGWAGVQANYHPVTFRKMYNVDTQKQAAAL